MWNVETRALVTARRLGEVPLSDLSWHPTAGLAAVDEKGAIYRWSPAETQAPDASADDDGGIDIGAPAACSKL